MGTRSSCLPLTFHTAHLPDSSARTLAHLVCMRLLFGLSPLAERSTLWPLPTLPISQVRRGAWTGDASCSCSVWVVRAWLVWRPGLPGVAWAETMDAITLGDRINQLGIAYHGSSYNWAGNCQAAQFWAEKAVGLSDSQIQTYSTARAAYNASSIVSKDMASAPAGSFSYYDASSAGHVVTNIGNGYCINTSSLADGTHYYEFGHGLYISRLADYKGGPDLGWSYKNGSNPRIPVQAWTPRQRRRQHLGLERSGQHDPSTHPERPGRPRPLPGPIDGVGASTRSRAFRPPAPMSATQARSTACPAPTPATTCRCTPSDSVPTPDPSTASSAPTLEGIRARARTPLT